jgi:hypothetical protein
MQFPIIVEIAVAGLLALTIGYCVVLNQRLQRLHADKDAMRQMIADLVSATNLANQAIKELKVTAIEADKQLSGRMEEANRFGIELANHVNAGRVLMDRIAKITSVAKHSRELDPVAAPAKSVKSALKHLDDRSKARENAA